MADELDETTALIQQHDGFENDEPGLIMARLARLLLLRLRPRLKALEDRVTALEQRLPPQ